MDARSLQLLELPKIIERLARECGTSLGAELAQALAPSTRIEEVAERLADTVEALAFLDMRRFPSFGGITDVRALTKRAEASGVLTVGELLLVADTLTGLRKLNEALTSPDARDKERLLTRAWRIKPQLELEHQIRAAIEAGTSALGSRTDSFEAAVKDEATEDLRRIRRAIRSLGEQVQVRLRRLISNSNFQKLLQEPIFTLRDDRYVVPVRSDNRHEVKGIVHDRSSSGGTFFIEPQEIVDLNNELRKFKLDERDEVERILRKLSREVGRHREVIEDSLRAAAELDFMFAKAKLAQRMRATCPALRTDGVVELKEARHPLLQDETGRPGDRATERLGDVGPPVAQSPSSVVPIDLRLGEDFDALFITGPNTGGKTVTLKTLGLLTFMAQCGLHVPAAEGARMTVFERVYADIGDEQSIEQSLSTFSSHMGRIIKFLRKADARTLVLIDEIGAGTDPDEGAALGKAIVRALLQRGAKVVVTTHYGELKLFAAGEPRIENASVEFDAKTLRPTYHLRIGIPGSSNAFSIAQRLGMPGNLIRRARHFLRRDRFEAAKVIRQLEQSQQEWERESELAAQAREDAELLREEYDEKVAAASGERQHILDEARAEAAKLLKHVRAEADDVMRRLRVQQRESKDTEAARAQLKQVAEVVREFAREESTAARELDHEQGREEEGNRELPLTSGTAVWIGSLKQYGVLLSPPDAHDRVSVRVGAAAVELDAREVKATTAAPETSAPPVAMHASRGYMSSELHLRGMTIDEAMPLLDKYLDDAMLAQMERVRVVHGKGTGTIRRAVHEALKKHPGVKSFHLAESYEGAEGVTIVHL